MPIGTIDRTAVWAYHRHRTFVYDGESGEMSRRWAVGLILVAALLATSPWFPAGTAHASSLLSKSQNTTPCAMLKVTATPKVNAQNTPYETVHNKVSSCATSTETVKLTETILGPFSPLVDASRAWTITLSPGQLVDKVRHIPYSCCGTYTVTDKLYSASGHHLATAKTSFTFA